MRRLAPLIALVLAMSTLPELSVRYAREAHAAGCPPDQLRNFGRAGIVLQPRQLAASAMARACDRPDGPTEVGYGGARGGGKSHWGLAQILCDDGARYPGLKFLYLRKVGKAGSEAVHDLRRDVLHSTPHKFSNNVLTRLDNGSRVVLGHFQHEKDIDNYLGLQYDGVLIEEATQLSSRKVRDITTCVRTVKPGWRPRKYFTTNPGNVGHAWFKDRFIRPFRAGAESNTRFVQATVRDNAFVNPEYRGELESLTGWQRRAWLDGDWDIAAGQFFTTFKREVHVGKSPTVVGPEWRVWIGLDHGFVHYTVAYLMALDGDGHLHVVAEHAERGWGVDRHCAALDAMLLRHGVDKSRIRTVAAGSDCFQRRDERPGGTVADQYKAKGYRLTSANMDRLNGAAEFLRRLGEPEAGKPPVMTISPLCARLAECIPTLEHDPHRPEDVLKVDVDDDGLGGDDPYDAARYGVMVAANRQPLKLIGA